MALSLVTIYREKGDHEAMVVKAGLCDGEGEHAYTIYDPVLGGEKYQNILNALQEQKPCKKRKKFDLNTFDHLRSRFSLTQKFYPKIPNHFNNIPATAEVINNV